MVSVLVFVRTSEGGFDTVGGELVAADSLLHATHRSPGLLADAIAGDLHRWAPAPLPRLESRLWPLMPRLDPRSRTDVVLPLWAAGRLPEGADPGSFGALERLAGLLGDQTLVAEAHAEFRRAMAADPLSHQMAGDSARLRALAADELARASDVDERPPLVALLPERFAIEELRHAIRRVLHRAEPDLETSSNFRRRIAELIRTRVLVPSGELVEPAGKGRPAQLYSFDRAGWRRWLAECVRAPRPRDHEDATMRASRALPRASDPGFGPHRNALEGGPPNRSSEAPRVRSEDAFEILAKQAGRAHRARKLNADDQHFEPRSGGAPRDAGDPQRDRVERLERLVRSLAGRIDEMSKRQAEPG